MSSPSRHLSVSTFSLVRVATLVGILDALAMPLVPACGTSRSAPRPAVPGAPDVSGGEHPAPAPATRVQAGATPQATLARPDELHLGDLRQLTFGGENAEAYFSPDGAELIFQARPIDAGCDRILRMSVLGRVAVPTAAACPVGSASAPASAPALGSPTAAPSAPGSALAFRPRLLPPVPIPVSSGAGATTCSFFLPNTRDVIFSSTHLAGPACPPRPDQRQGYVWAIHPAYDIFRASRDGTNLRRLTDTPGYDAEATVCPVDGSIVFTSVRDGDLELYRMDSDGGHVRRLTNQIGYDGGAFFDRDCSHIVWRASRPAPGSERDSYQALLRQGLVRPTKLELWIAESDGSNPMQITYLDAASFAPSFFPDQPRIIFSSNVGDPRGREFDLWAVDMTGANLERLTTAPGFDGFPMFSPDGRHLAFSSNRATAPGAHDTNVFVASWQEKVVHRFAETAADRILTDVRWLASPERGGRGIGTAGLEASGTFIEARLQRVGLQPAGEGGSFRQVFQVPTDVKVGEDSSLAVGGVTLARDDFTIAAYSGAGHARGDLLLAGYGIVEPRLGVDDYRGLDARNKIVVVRRFAPEGAPFTDPEQRRRAGDVRRKVFTAREKGARALLIVDAPLPPVAPEPPVAPLASAGGRGSPGTADAMTPTTWKMPEEAAPPGLRAEGYGDAGIPVLFVRRAPFGPALARLEHKGRVKAELQASLTVTQTPAYNVVARVAAGVSEEARQPGSVVIGAHYDHLGLGEHHSLEPDSHKPHVGADDNASGAATLIEVARIVASRRHRLARDVLFVAFSGEEEGTLGSTAFMRAPPPPLTTGDIVAMVNLDMVGRLRDNKATVLGRGSAREWPALLEEACAKAHIDCGGTAGGSDGYGPSDQMPFYVAGIPVAHFFTGSHPDYHRPSDTADKINAAGAGQIAVAAAALVEELASRPDRLKLEQPVPGSGPGGGDMRSFGASLGTIPDYAGPPAGKPGVLLAGVRAGGAAEAGGLRRGDILIRLGRHEIRSVEDLMYALGASKPGETTTAVVTRAGQEMRLPVTFQSSPRSSAPSMTAPHP